MDGNRFYVQPGGDFGQGLAGLAQTLGQSVKQRQFDEMKQQAAEVFKSGDPNLIAEFSLKNPEIAQQLGTAQAFRSKQTEENYVKSLFDAINNPDKIPEIAAKRQEFLRSQGVPPEQTQETDTLVERYSQDPEGTLQMMKQELAFMAPERFLSMRKATEVEKGAEPTANVKDYMFYRTLLREDPEQAAKFAQQVGIDKEESKTEAIKEFEYAEKNPRFALKQQEKAGIESARQLSEKAFGNASELRKEFLKESGDYQKVRDAYTRVIQSTKETSPAGDLSLIFNYMKMLDPGSVVRESEFATAASAGSYGERIKAAVDKAVSGERLTDSMRNDFLSKSRTLFEGSEKQHKKREKTYSSLAAKNSLPVDQVVVDITRPVEEETQPEEKPIDKMSPEELQKIIQGDK